MCGESNLFQVCVEFFTRLGAPDSRQEYVCDVVALRIRFGLCLWLQLAAQFL